MAAGALLLVGGVVAAILLAPEIDEAKERDAARRERIEERRQEERRQTALRVQRARTGSVPVVRSERGRMLDLVAERILGDARRRAASGELARTARLIECEPFPRSATTVDPRRDLAARRGRYTCLAVTIRRGETEHSAAFDIGYPYRVAMDFQTGRYGFCRVVEQPGEGALRGRPLAPLSEACT